MFKKISSSFIAVCLVVNLFIFPSSAATYNTGLPYDEYIIQHLENFEKEIDVTHYVKYNNWTFDKCLQEYMNVLFEHPEVFFVESAISGSYNTLGTKYTLTNIRYNISKSEYAARKRSLDDEVAKAMTNVKNTMTDVEKALALHDYLVKIVEYDNTLTKRSAYDALVGRKAVCQGYALAYSMLLTKAGIENIMVGSDPMNHAWNYVKIGSDWYHVDTTSDDPMFTGNDMYGRVTHEFFLLSDAAIKKMGHHGWSLPGYPAATNTKYDNKFWRKITTPMVNLGDNWYYIKLDETSPAYKSNYKTNSTSDPYYTMYSYLYKYNFATNTASKQVKINSTWFVWGTEDLKSKSWWEGSYSQPAEFNGNIYYNDAKSIYKYDPETKKSTRIYTPDINGYIYGMTTNNNVIRFAVKQAPDDSGTIKKVKVSAAKATSLSLDYNGSNVINVTKGNTFQLNASTTPQGNNDYIKFDSTNPKVATVDAKGKVTAKKTGTCQIIATTANKRKMAVTVKVK